MQIFRIQHLMSNFYVPLILHIRIIYLHFLDPISDYKRNTISVDCPFPFHLFCKMAQNAKKSCRIKFCTLSVRLKDTALHFLQRKNEFIQQSKFCFFADSWHLKRIFCHIPVFAKIHWLKKDVLVSKSNYKPIWMKRLGGNGSEWM